MELQWADSLLEMERLHLLKLTVWGSLSVVVGVLLLGALRLRRVDSPLLHHFGIQTAAWGAIDLALVFWAGRSIELRDYAAATRLDRFIWFNIGLDVGYVGIGITLALCGYLLGRRLGLVGAGLGVIVQGMALAVLDLQLAGTVVR